MKLRKNILLAALFGLLLQGCMMMPWGMGGMGSFGGMHGGMETAPRTGYEINASIIEGDYSLKLEALISESYGNSKFFINLENMNTGLKETDYYGELNLYRVPFEGAPITEILKNAVVEGLPFETTGGSVQYANYSLIPPGEYFLTVRVLAVEGYELDSPLNFDYRFDYYAQVESSAASNEFLGVNYWLWAVIMTVTMGVMMLGFGVLY